MTQRPAALDPINETNISPHLRHRFKGEWRALLKERLRPGDIYVTFAFNGSTRVQRWAKERAQREQKERFLSPAARQRLSSRKAAAKKKIDLGYTKRALTISGAHSILYKFCNLLDRFNLGPRYHKKRLSERCSLIAFGENLDTNFHFEGVLRIPCIKRGVTLNDALAVAFDKWRDLTQAGVLNIEQHIRSDEAVRIYITKQLARLGAWESFFCKGEFRDPSSDGE